jgi:hypothetical protein
MTGVVMTASYKIYSSTDVFLLLPLRCTDQIFLMFVNTRDGREGGGDKDRSISIDCFHKLLLLIQWGLVLLLRMVLWVGSLNPDCGGAVDNGTNPSLLNLLNDNFSNDDI